MSKPAQTGEDLIQKKCRQKKAIGDWLDRQYLIQCRLAAEGSLRHHSSRMQKTAYRGTDLMSFSNPKFLSEIRME